MSIVRGLGLGVRGNDFATILKRGNSKGSALTGLAGKVLFPRRNGILISNSRAGPSSDVFSVHGGINVMFRGPSGRVITSVMRRSITFKIRGLNIPPRRYHEHISRTVGAINVCRRHLGTPRGLSNNRGRHITITKVVTVGPRYVILSRPATVLSPDNETRILRAVGGLGGRSNVAIILVARCVSRTIRTSEIIIVSNNRVIVSSAPRGIFTGISRIGSCKLSIPRTARLIREVGLGPRGAILGTSRYISCVISLLRSWRTYAILQGVRLPLRH